MKSKILITIGLLLAMIVNTSMFAQSDNSIAQNVVTSTFKVYGNCDMCKSRIEKAALGVKGVKTAAWDKDSKMLKVETNSNTKVDDIQQVIAKVGHDTEKFKADDNAYNSLPGCCKYRK